MNNIIKCDEKELIRIISENTSINCIAFVHRHSLHMYYAFLASIKSMEEKGIHLKGYLIFVGAMQNALNISINGLTDFQVVELLENKSLINSINHILCSMVPYSTNSLNVKYIISQEVFPIQYYILIKLYKNSNIKWIEIEDGIKSYIDSNKFDIAQIISSKEKFLRKLALSINVRTVCSHYIRNRFINNNNYVNALFFKRNENKKLILNTPYGNIYKEILKNNFNLSYEKIKIFENAIVINLQCLEEDNYVSAGVEYNIIKSVVLLLKNQRYKIIIKPHPRLKNVNQYKMDGVYLFTENISQEMILANLKESPKCLISFFSTSLLYSSLLFGIKTISLLNIIIKYVNMEDVRLLLKENIKFFENIVYMPNQLEEIPRLLE